MKSSSNSKSRIIISAFSLFLCFVLFIYLGGQAFISYDSRARISIIYRVFYHISLVAVVLLFISIIGVCFIPRFRTIYDRLSLIYQTKRKVLVKVNYSVLVLFCLIISSISLLNIISPIQNKSISEVSVLYDEGSLIEFFVKPLFTPLAINAKRNNIQVSVQPLSEDSIIKSLTTSKYLFILSHGSDGKMYSTNPLTAYSCELFSRINKGKLMYAYFTACDLGYNGNHANWISAMEPAKIVIYDRESSILENVVFILSTSKNI